MNLICLSIRRAYTRAGWLAICFLLLCGTAQAQALPDSLLAAAAEHPAVLRYQQQWESAAAGSRAAGFLPEPRLGAGYFIQPIETRVGPQRLRLSLSQAFPWPGTLAAMREQSSAMAAEAWFRYRDARAMQQEKLSLHWESLCAQAQVLVQERAMLSLLQQIEETLVIRYEVGTVPLSDVLSHRMRQDDARTSVARIEEEVQSLWRQVLLLAGLSPKAALPTALVQQELELLEDSHSPESHPAWQALEARLQTMQEAESLARLQGRPQLAAGIDYIITAPRSDMNVPDNGRNALAPTLSLSLPLFGKKYKASQEAAAAQSEAVGYAQEALRNDFALRWEQAHTALVNARKTLALAARQEQELDRLYDLTMRAFTSDEVPVTRVYALTDQMIYWQKQRVHARRDSNRAIRQLQYLQAVDTGTMPHATGR